ncbi:MAG: HNH endonuclease [Halioglobus sp.]
MTSFHEAISKVEGRHRQALNWFNEHRGQQLTWSEIKSQADEGTRLVNQAKGIYKPAYTDLALSVRTIQDGPYPDKEVEYRSDGSWVCQYYQENIDPAKRDTEATNRGLMRCMKRQVPVGFLIKRKPKPGVEYEILGVGFVVGWENGYFTIEGVNNLGELTVKQDATRARALNGHKPSIHDVEFDLNEEDLREKQIATVAVGRGQGKFRAELLHAYEGRCCVTGCDLPSVLEAAHISPYRGEQSNHKRNGLLLRADIHTLFDLGLICVDESNRLVVAPSLSASSSYRDLNGRLVRPPREAASSPSAEALRKHRNWSGL